MATKVNFVLDDDVKAELDRVVDSGRRSRVVNEVGNIVGLKHPDDAAALMMKDRRVTFYDAACHAAALAQDGVFVTADAVYLRKARAEGGVVHLAEWTLG